MADNAAYVQEGDRLVIDVRGGKDETLAWVTTVAPACESHHTGYWYCDTCRRAANNNMDIGKCAEKAHRLAWICFEHGPEVPA